MSNDVKKWVYLLVLSLIWGSSYILIKKGLVGLSPVQLGSFRILMTTFILLLFGYKSLQRLVTQSNGNGWHLRAFWNFFPLFSLCFFRNRNQQFCGSCFEWINAFFTLIIAYLFFNQGIKKKQIGGVLWALQEPFYW